MKTSLTRALVLSLVVACGIGAAAPQKIDLAAQLAASKLRVANRDKTKVQASGAGIHVPEGTGPGVVWIEGSDFGEGTIEIDVKGRDVNGQSFVGVAFHGKDDQTYEAVYVRPFNFKTDDKARHHHAVQYMAAPDFDWPRLRKEFPEEFVNAVDPSLSPTDWVPLRIVVQAKKVQVFVGHVDKPTLDVRKLGQQDKGLIGLWTGNNSDGDFANLRISH